MRRKLQKTLHILLNIFLVYLIYFLISGILIFLIDYNPIEANEFNSISTENLYGDEEGPDRVILLEDGETALAARFNLIEKAQESIKIANFKLESGEVSDILYALLIEVANRGVKVELLLDGVAHNLHGQSNELYWALISNENIEIRFYEPVDLLRPWTLNNRLHDKIFIIDGKEVLTGGRNIGDSYYLKDAEGKYAYDRDVIVYNHSNSNTQSVIPEFETYFNELYNHDLTQVVDRANFASFKEEGMKTIKELSTKLESARRRNEEYLSKQLDWKEVSFPTNQVSLLTNPIERFKKQPIILQTLNNLMLSAKDTVLTQTPYLIWNDELQNVVNFEAIDAEVHILTNSETSSNNFPGVAGFLNLKDELLENVTQIYGFQGDGSIHAKTYIIDNRLSLVGSFNFDPRSAFLSTENLVVIDSEPFTEALTNEIYKKIETSKAYNEKNHIITESVEEPDSIPWNIKAIIRTFRLLLFPFDELL